MAGKVEAGFLKEGDKPRSLVMRVKPEVAQGFAALVKGTRRGARSAALVAVIAEELARHGVKLDDARFDEPKRRG